MTRILLIEDDKLLGEGFRDFLIGEGFDCHWLRECKHVSENWPQADLVILNRQMPEGDSLQFLVEWLILKAIPVIVLTAKNEQEQRAEGLMAGARDYVLKPFSQRELVARIRAQLQPFGDSTLHYQDVHIDPSKRTVINDDQSIYLKPKEFQLLLLLVQNQGHVFHRDELLNTVWGFRAFPSMKTVDNHILHLREKIPSLAIETLGGVGYRLMDTRYE